MALLLMRARASEEAFRNSQMHLASVAQLKRRALNGRHAELLAQLVWIFAL
jgi:hypothetical protein